MADEKKYSEDAVDAAFSKIEEEEAVPNDDSSKEEQAAEATAKASSLTNVIDRQKAKLERAKEERRAKREQKQAEKEQQRLAKETAKAEKLRLKEERRAEKKRKWEEGRPRRRRIFMVISALFILLVAAGGALYYHYVQYFSNHFYKGTTINGLNVSYQTVADVKAGIEQDVAQYQLAIQTLDGTETLSANEIGWEYVDDRKVDKLMASQDPWRWIIYLSDARRFEISAGTTYDAAKVEAAIDRLSCLNEDITEPIDAKLVENTEGSYVIEPETEGNEIDVTKLKAAVKKALDAAEEKLDIVKEDCYVHPKVYANDKSLVKRMNDWNKFLSISISYKFGDETETVSANGVKRYVRDNGTKVTLLSDWISRLVNSWAEKYNSFGKAQTFRTHANEEITLPSGGSYGWLLDQRAMIDDLTECLNEGKSGAREPVWLYRAKGWDNGGFTGNYIEIDKTAQKLYLYQDGEVALETDIITGNPNRNQETEGGVYAVSAMEEDTTLGAEEGSQKVKYLCTFNGNQGICDASFKESFGGENYQIDGSAGCVLIPEENMKQIYESISVGTAVVIY